MSMELLKEIDEKFDECYERNLKPSFEWMVGVSERLKKVLTHPDIKPVAWALFSKKIMPSGVAYAVRRVEIELAQIEADLDIQDAEIKPLFTYHFTSLERERFRTLERVCAGVTQDAIDGGWTVMGMMNYAKGLESKIKSLEYQLKQLSTLHFLMDDTRKDYGTHIPTLTRMLEDGEI